MRGIFYSPFVKADAEAPSGASQMASLLRRALVMSGVELSAPVLPSTYDGKGDATRQEEARRTSLDAAERLVVQISKGEVTRPDFWFSYHVYYKSPDWIGPEVSRRLSIPYIIAEGSHAPKRQGGPWAMAHGATTEALKAASLLLAMTQFDRFCLEWIDATRVRDLRPFIDTSPFASVERKAAEGVRLLAVGMMRNERKKESYRLLADALRLAGEPLLSLTIAGDGKFRGEVEGYFAGLSNIRFLGAVTRERLPALMADADVCAWPGVGEAYGLAYLEAQAAGLPVVALRERGVVDVTVDSETALLSDAAGLASSIKRLANDPALRASMSVRARAFACGERSLEVAAARLRRLLSEVVS